MSFSDEVDNFRRQAVNRTEEVSKAIVISLFRSVIMDTPVLEGRLRGDWQITKGAPASTSKTAVDPGGDATVKEVTSFVAAQNGDFDLFLTNHMPYATRIEYEGYSKKAPAGMVRRNVSRIALIVHKAIAEGRL